MESEGAFRYAFEHVPVGMSFTLPTGEVDVNDTLCRMLGYAREELASRTWQELTHPDDIAESALQMARMTSGEQDAVRYLKRYLKKDGSVVWADVFSKLRRDEDGEPLYFMTAIVDVTERERLMQELEDEHARFKLLLENSYDAVLLGRPDGSIDFANPAACRMYGRTEEEMRAIGRRGLVDATDPRFAEALDARARSGRFVRVMRNVRADGTTFTAEVANSLYTDHEGVERVGMVIRDLSEREAAEEALRRSEAMRATAEEVARMGSWGWTPGSPTAAWSPGMCRLFDIEPGEFDGFYAPILDARVHAEDRALLDEAAALSLSGVCTPVDCRVIWRDGSEHILHGEAVVQYGDDGAVKSVTGYFQDVTGQRRAEEESRRGEQANATLLGRLNEAQSLASIGSWEWDLLTDVVWWSDETYRIFGVSADEYVPSFEGNGAFIHPDDRADYGRLFELSLKTGVPLEYDFRLVTAGGKEKLCNARGEVVADPDARPIRFVGTVMDITARKLAEEEIRRLNEELEQRVVSRTAQLEAANRELESFAYAVSHDLRTPLRAINGFSAMVVEDAGDRLGPEDVEHLQRVRAGAERMALLIDELLGLSRASRATMHIERVDLSAMATEVLDELRAGDPERRVDTVVAPGMHAAADAVLLRTILVNLLGNAWKFTSRHETARIEVGVTQAGGERAFFVRDDGAGFDRAQAARLFGAFQRLHSADQFPGDGIGLATVQRLVSRHGGRVWAEAEVEKGAMFAFTLPAPDPAG